MLVLNGFKVVKWVSFIQQAKSKPKTSEWNRCLKSALNDKNAGDEVRRYLTFNVKCKQWRTFWWTWCENNDALKPNGASIILDSWSKFWPPGLSMNVDDQTRGKVWAARGDRVQKRYFTFWFVSPQSFNHTGEVCEFHSAAPPEAQTVSSAG